MLRAQCITVRFFNHMTFKTHAGCHEPAAADIKRTHAHIHQASLRFRVWTSDIVVLFQAGRKPPVSSSRSVILQASPLQQQFYRKGFAKSCRHALKRGSTVADASAWAALTLLDLGRQAWHSLCCRACLAVESQQ